MYRLALIALLIVLAAPDGARSVQPDEMLKDPALEARARDLSRELRCMVCQNQSIDDSEAPLARDLRLLVRERLTEEIVTSRCWIFWCRAMARLCCSSRRSNGTHCFCGGCRQRR